MTKARDKLPEDNDLREIFCYKLTSSSIIESISIYRNPHPWLDRIFIEFRTDEDSTLAIFFTNSHLGFTFYPFGYPPTSLIKKTDAALTEETIQQLKQYADFLFLHSLMDNFDRINFINMIDDIYHLEKRDEDVHYLEILSNHPLSKAMKDGDTNTLVNEILYFQKERATVDTRTVNNALAVLVSPALNIKNKRGLERKIHIDAIEYLLGHGAELNTFQRCDDVGILKLFLSKGADINYPEDQTGYTLMHYAVCNPNVNLDFIRFILQKGANIGIKDNYGFMPLDHLQTLIHDVDPSPKVKSIIQNIPKIYAIIMTYLINHNQFGKLVAIAAKYPYPSCVQNCLNLIKCSEINDASSKEFIIMVNMTIEYNEASIFFNDNWCHFINKITNRIYPDILNVIDKITSIENFTLVKTALLYAKDKSGFVEALGTVVQMCESNILNFNEALKLKALSDKMQIYYDRYKQMNIQLTHVDKSIEDDIFALARSLHRALLSDGAPSEYRGKCIIYGRNSVILRYGLFTESNTVNNNKINQIATSRDWTTLSQCSLFNSRGETRVCMDLIQIDHQFRNTSKY